MERDPEDTLIRQSKVSSFEFRVSSYKPRAEIGTGVAGSRLRLCHLVIIVLLLALPARAQQTTTEAARAYTAAHQAAIFKEFVNLLSIPNVASDRANIRRNAEFIRGMMERRGLHPRLLETSDPNTPPAVYGEWTTPSMSNTLVLYAHYDGQPTDPKQWTGTQPWVPALRS